MSKIDFMSLKTIDFCDDVRDGTHDSPKHLDSGKLLITSKNIKGDSIDFENASYISEKDYNKINERSLVEINDVLYSMIGTVGLVYRVDQQPNYAIKNMGLFKIHDELKRKWLYYYLNSPKAKGKVLSMLSGSTQKFISLSNLRNLEIEFPQNIDDAKRIIKICESIDKKIKLNNKINNNLFELLKQEFREKFYNKEEKNSYLIDYISETIGGDWGRESPEGNNNTKVYCVRGTDIPSMEYGNKGNAPIRYILEKNYKNKKLDPNNIIIEISGGSPTQSTGRTAYITKSILDMYNSPLLCTNFCRAIEAKSDILAPFVYMNLKLMYEDDIFFNWENGTTGIKNLALNDMLSNVEVVIPDEDAMKEYYLLFNNVMNKISGNSNENIKLEQLKDTLLPKLMNGEIDLDKIDI